MGGKKKKKKKIVDGVDSSADMLDRLRASAAARGLSVTVHQQRMEDLDLPRRYRSIFLAGATFTLLATDDLALRALRAIRRAPHRRRDRARPARSSPHRHRRTRSGPSGRWSPTRARRSGWAWSTRTGTPPPGRVGPRCATSGRRARASSGSTGCGCCTGTHRRASRALAVRPGSWCWTGPSTGDAQEFTVRLGRAGPGRYGPGDHRLSRGTSRSGRRARPGGPGAARSRGR